MYKDVCKSGQLGGVGSPSLCGFQDQTQVFSFGHVICLGRKDFSYTYKLLLGLLKMNARDTIIYWTEYFF